MTSKTEFRLPLVGRQSVASIMPGGPRRTPGEAQGPPDRAVVVAPLAGSTGNEKGGEANPDRRDPVANFIEIEIEARKCHDVDALRFSIVNATRRIAEFDQAFLVEPGLAGAWLVTRAAGVSSIDQSAPLIRAVARWLGHPRHTDLLARGNPRQANIEKERLEWGFIAEPFPLEHALWLPIRARDGRVMAALLALKRENWRPQHVTLLLPLADAYGHAWEALLPRGTSGMAGARRLVAGKALAIGALSVMAVCAFIPVPMSTLAPSEIVGAEVTLVTAPVDGVIAEILAPPGAWVERETPIVKFVDIKSRNDFEVAGRNVAVAESRYFKTIQSATAVQKDQQDLSTTKAELEVAKAELAYTRDVLDRTVVRAQTSGLLIYSAKSDLIGKPVATGERLMEIANPDKTEIKIEMPVSDAIVLAKGNRVSLFPDGDPLSAIDGRIAGITYRPVLSAEQQLVFRVLASIDKGRTPRIGLRGIARVSGERVSLWFYLFRRPLGYLRQRIGL